MVQQTHREGVEPVPQAMEDSWRALVFASEPGEDISAPYAEDALKAWPTDELLAEVLQRSADNIPALRHMQGTVLQALLGAIDQDPAPYQARR